MTPAVVLGIDTPIGLAIVRSLGRHGVPVTGIARGMAAPGLSSRYLREGLLRADDAQGTLEQLESLSRRLGPACLFAISEGDIALLNRHRDRLAGYRLMFPDARRMDAVLDKHRTYAAARAAGVPVPRTVQPATLDDAAAAAPELRYPVVLKWAEPNEAGILLRRAGLELDKTRYCHDANELLAYLRRFEPVGRYPMIQEYCAGYGLGQFFLVKDGVAHAVFQHRRLHEWPPEGGVSTLCESVGLEHHAALRERSLALLRELDWEGIAMVEYRYDPQRGEAALMEINGRFWGSLPLACHAGVDFPWLAYCLLGNGAAQPQPAYRAGMRCRFMIPETKRLARLLFQPGAVADRQLAFSRGRELLGYLADFLRPSMRYYLFTWSDPAPFLRDLWHVVRR
ncbi:putative ATP-grasp superfamily ATP-dependent carboligase [Pseudoduganella flava]|uniref:Carboxylate--amine ligase n=1 Tax=Pseudoduganella flava TaxID=871742 RepID=A0A562PNM1_9BURK|nr:ATP-grasp domain-containing protein [Pseudoduganella flava]QGZ40578.1 carboxylate--amine ligase [Pseudoduganella flava]TWI46024.1 putative ATP-grasp superfamily ATP-dependent carboligase [Pseudoduganella flava]